MITFVILHYMAREETEGCIKSLDKLCGEKRIVIVDNASPNGSGVIISELYKKRNDITVVLNNENTGFAKGNNLGCQVAKERYNPDFYVVMNNDIEIPQADFLSKVEQIYQAEQFDVLGPDIFSTTGRVHQSPKTLKKTTIEDARRQLEIYKKKKKSKILVPYKCFLKRFSVLKRAVKIVEKKAKGIDYNKKYYNVPLHGACFIFSRKFIESRKEAFFNGTFFYYESEILDYECNLEKKRVIYDPSIVVLHHQNISTNAVFKNELKKVRFMNDQNYNSISAFLKQYDS